VSEPEKSLSKKRVYKYGQLYFSVTHEDEITAVERERNRLLLDLALVTEERDVEQAAHDAIASICFTAGAETADGTSVSAVLSLADRLRKCEEERDKLREGLRRTRFSLRSNYLEEDVSLLAAQPKGKTK
jgi:cytochrome P450